MSVFIMFMHDPTNMDIPSIPIKLYYCPTILAIGTNAPRYATTTQCGIDVPALGWLVLLRQPSLGSPGSDNIISKLRVPQATRTHTRLKSPPSRELH